MSKKFKHKKTNIIVEYNDNSKMYSDGMYYLDASMVVDSNDWEEVIKPKVMFNTYDNFEIIENCPIIMINKHDLTTQTRDSIYIESCSAAYLGVFKLFYLREIADLYLENNKLKYSDADLDKIVSGVASEDKVYGAYFIRVIKDFQLAKNKNTVFR